MDTLRFPSQITWMSYTGIVLRSIKSCNHSFTCLFCIKSSTETCIDCSIRDCAWCWTHLQVYCNAVHFMPSWPFPLGSAVIHNTCWFGEETFPVLKWRLDKVLLRTPFGELQFKCFHSCGQLTAKNYTKILALRLLENFQMLNANMPSIWKSVCLAIQRFTLVITSVCFDCCSK